MDIEETLEHVPTPHMTGAVERYLRHGIHGGSFLTAVLSNDLKGAAIRADMHNLVRLGHWGQWVVNYCPQAAQGSPEIVTEWCNAGGLDGLAKSEAGQG